MRSARLVGTLAMALMVASLMSCVAEDIPERRRSSNAFRAILLGLANYRDTHGAYPPSAVMNGGDPLYSWRFLILKYIDGKGPEGVASDRSWRDPANQKWRESPFWLYCYGTEKQELSTNVMGVVGEGSAFDVGAAELDDLDGDAILIIEVNGSTVHWMAPGDLDLQRCNGDESGTVCGMRVGTSRRGFHVGFVDGEVWFLSTDTPAGTLRKLMTVEGAATHERDALLSKYRIQ